MKNQNRNILAQSESRRASIFMHYHFTQFHIKFHDFTSSNSVKNRQNTPEPLLLEPLGEQHTTQIIVFEFHKNQISYNVIITSFLFHLNSYLYLYSREPVVWRLPGMQEVLGWNHIGGNLLCSLSPLEATIN